MSRNVTVTEAAKQFDALIAAIGDIEEARIVDDDGEIVAVIVSPDAYRQNVRDRFWATVDRIRERNSDKDPEEVYREITEIVEEVRREQYEADQQRIAHRRP